MFVGGDKGVSLLIAWFSAMANTSSRSVGTSLQYSTGTLSMVPVLASCMSTITRYRNGSGAIGGNVDTVGISVAVPIISPRMIRRAVSITLACS